MPVYIIRVDTDGTCEDVSGELGELVDQFHHLASVEFDGETSVCMLRHPLTKVRERLAVGDTVCVGIIHDWGRSRGHALNVKAWALYGGSVVCGPMFVANDAVTADGLRAPIPGMLAAALLGTDDWVGDDVRGFMRKWIHDHADELPHGLTID